MTDDTRLRRLDALFAERVMGYPSPNMANGAQLPAFTRSLDAAWEGATKLSYLSLSVAKMSSGIRADVSLESDPECEFVESASHPAEALVLACLRAVGVEESELQ